MATKYDMLTNEGTLALARAVSTGAKIIIRGATLCNVTSGMGSVEDVANLTWSDISSSAIAGATLQCSSYLPSMYDASGTETGKPLAALDIEFDYMPSESVTYNVVAVLADVYYPLTPFKSGSDYSVGTVVWYMDTTGASSYYICIKDVTSSSAPGYDTEHWQSVTLASTLDTRYGGLQYSSITTEPVLLYVSKVSGTITVGPEMEIDYKVRLYIEGVKNAASVSEYIVFDTLGPEFMASAQLALLAEFATQLNRVRDVAMVRASRE